MTVRMMTLPLLLAFACTAADKEVDDSVPDQDRDGVASPEDCDDDNAEVFPGAAEVCDGIDNDCDQITDGDDPDVDLSTGDTWYLDEDLDGIGDDASPVQACSQPINASPDAGDCDGDNARVNPFADEVCDGIDNDCDGKIDGDDSDVDIYTGSIYYMDEDGDGYGDFDKHVRACAPGDGAVDNDDDCDDGDADINPDAGETPYNGIDEDCDTATPDDDLDRDGQPVAEDCDDNDAGAYYGPGGSCVAGSSCLDVQANGYDKGNGVYTIDLDGEGSGLDPIAVACDMETYGGGWTLTAIFNSNMTSTLEDWGAGYVNTADLAYSPADASATTTGLQGWLDLNLFDYTTLRLVSAFDGAETFSSEEIQRSELRISFGEDGYYLYNDSNGYVWCGGARSFTDYGTGQVNRPSGAYANCKDHAALGSGWDFSTTAYYYNQGLTLCGYDGDRVMSREYGPSIWTNFGGTPAAAQGVWAR